MNSSDVNRLKKELERVREENRILTAKLQFRNYIESYLGLDIDKICQFENKVIEYKKEYEKELLNSDEDKTENAILRIQNTISKYAVEMVARNDSHNVERYSNILKDEFEEVWKVLDKKSKTFLVTAKITFNSLRLKDKNDELDYSGVCLLVTKALEVELYRVFFEEYIQSLKDNQVKMNRYPGILLLDDGSLKPDYLFNMGLVVPIYGLRRDDNEIKEGSIYNYRTFLRYAKENLYEFSNDKLIEEVYRNAYFVERVRKDYRNPSAHRGYLTRTKCLECFDYIVDTEKQMKRMLGNMDKRNKKFR